jgi:hypothetical protein
MITDEAVGAAAKAIERQFPYDENAAYMARLALEAAAPYLMRDAKADAWDECDATKYILMLKADGSGLTRVKTNPYRSQE